jgi:chemotaxis protein MotB
MAAKAKKTAGWIFTFADLMALILTFFVLLLSFATLDARKYEAVVESFGSVFSGGRGLLPGGLGFLSGEGSVVVPLPLPGGAGRSEPEHDRPVVESATHDPRRIARRFFDEVGERLADEISAGAASLSLDGERVTLRFREEVSFPSGQSGLTADFRTSLDRIAVALEGTAGDVIVSGHTDDLPIATDRYRSNWELSSARAVSVVHHLIARGLDPARLVPQGRADSMPLAANDSPQNRARNRRVEIEVVVPPAPYPAAR